MRSTVILACAVGLFAALVSVYPQYRLQTIRGGEFNGAFATYDLDEMAYAAYLQALIDGRPRRNDPYTGRDDTPASSQPESLFSIQFVTAYMIVAPSRAFGMSAGSVMPVISAVSAFFTVLAIFWLALLLTGDRWLAAAVALAVFACGALITGIGVIGTFQDGGIAYPFIPFLRRHIPALSFPFLFLFFGAIWKGSNCDNHKRQILWAGAAAFCFAVLLFSYFYLWTTAAAGLAICIAMYLVLESEGRLRTLIFAFEVIAFILPPALAYVYLMAGRSDHLDSTQLLVHTREIDISRNIVGLGIITAAVAGLIRQLGREALELRTAIFAASIALVGVAVFNQQVLTGRSLQPFHYEYYSANYVVLFALALTTGIGIKAAFRHSRLIPATAFAVLGIACATWGAFEAVETAALWDDTNVVRDEAMPINRRIRELVAAGEVSTMSVTLNAESLQADSQPTLAPVGVLWARHQHAFAGIRGPEENRARYYRLIYYLSLDHEWLRDALTDCSNIESCMALFGWDRFNATLSKNARPLTKPEIDAEAERYREFVRSFDRDAASDPALSLIVYRRDDVPDMGRLGNWYDIGDEETAGRYAFRRLTLKGQ